MLTRFWVFANCGKTDRHCLSLSLSRSSLTRSCVLVTGDLLLQGNKYFYYNNLDSKLSLTQWWCLLERNCHNTTKWHHCSTILFSRTQSTEDAWKFSDVFLISRMQTWENRESKSQKTLRAVGVRKPVSFKLALGRFIPACFDFISIFIYNLMALEVESNHISFCFD